MSYRIQNLSNAKEAKHPFGVVREFFSDTAIPNFNLARIKMTDDHLHHHKKTTELYYILSGNGRIELDGEKQFDCLYPVQIALLSEQSALYVSNHEIGPDTAILIEPGTRHRARAYEGQEFNLLVFSMPAYDPRDEFREE